MKAMFPSFKKLEISDRYLFEDVQKKYPPYSDHRFSGRFSYNTDNDCLFSLLHGNLVLKYNDYNDKHPVFTFSGENNLDDTVKELFKYLKDSKTAQILTAVPEHSLLSEINHLESQFNITEDRDNFDYILDVDTLIELPGNKLHTKRQKIHLFLSTYPKHSIFPINIGNPDVQKEIENLFLTWQNMKQKSLEETDTELKALRRLFKYSKYFNLVNIGIYIGDKLVGFSINEVLKDGYYLGHFGKFHPKITGGFQYLEHITAKCMKEFGCKFMNYEQDLGIPGLRDSKMSWRPVKFLKKYIVKPKVYLLELPVFQMLLGGVTYIYFALDILSLVQS